MLQSREGRIKPSEIKEYNNYQFSRTRLPPPQTPILFIPPLAFFFFFFFFFFKKINFYMFELDTILPNIALLGKLSSPRQMGLYPNQGPVDIAGPT